MNQDNRVVVLIDMDCFYCQVEEKLNPDLKGKPIAVVQYNPWKGGGIIAVNYVARAMGVSRHMRGDEAKEKCPEIQLPSVPCQRGKADITKYRDAGKEVAKVLQKFTSLLERASIDEAYLDITAPVQERLKIINTSSIDKELLLNTYALGYDSIEDFMTDVHGFSNDSIDFDLENARQLLVAAVIVTEIRAAVYEQTGYQCSAGIAHNKILAKLVCGMNKPNKQTVLPKHSINILYRTLPVKKVKHLGGKFGDIVCTSLKIKNMGELQRFTEKELQSKFDDKNGSWLYNIARGIDLEPVQARFNPKSIGCCKQFRGKTALIDLDSLRKWLKDLGEEIDDRLEKDALENNRTPKQMVVSFSSQLANGKDSSSSRSYNFSTDDELCGELFSSKALELVLDSIEGSKIKDFESNKKLKTPIKFLGISVGKFEDNLDKKTKRINDYFGAATSKDVIKTKDISKEITESAKELNTIKRNDGKEYILDKFFQVTDKIQDKREISTSANETLHRNNNAATIETTLDKQESFFEKFLSKAPIEKSKINNMENFNKNAVESKNESSHVTTPICNVINCGEDSNDTEYSGSTINMEINKSIALFEEDPEDIARVSNMRQLLNNSAVENCRDTEIDDICNYNDQYKNKDTIAVLHTENIESTGSNQSNQCPTAGENFNCSECGKTIPIEMFEIHGDYHFALKLREEERRQIRQEVKEKSNQKSNNESRKNKVIQGQNNKNESGSSIANFLVKIDNSVPMETCSECGKKVERERLVEHLDFHEAQKLNRELNKKPISNITVSASTVKRKRKILSPMKNAKVPCKSIDSFFR